MSDRHTPAVLAELDQAAAGIDDEVDLLLFVANGLITDHGTTQGGADLTAFLAYKFEPVALAAIAARALVQLSQQRTGPVQP